jgi:hypothetical protein
MKLNFNITNHEIKLSIALLILCILIFSINKSNISTKLSNENANLDYVDDVAFIEFIIDQNRPFSRYYDSDIMNTYDFFSEKDKENVRKTLYELISYLENIEDANESDISHTVMITYKNGEIKNIKKNISPRDFDFFSLKLMNSKLSEDSLRFTDLIDMMKDNKLAVPHEMSTDR